MKTNLIVLWTARISSIISFLLLSTIFIGEGFNPTSINSIELLLFFFFPIFVIVGFMIAWRKELIGSIISLSGLAMFYLFHYISTGNFPRGFAFLVFTIPAFLFMLNFLYIKIL